MGVLKAVGALIGLAVAAFLIAALTDRSPQLSPAEKIRLACQSEYRSEGEVAVNDCQIRLLLKRIGESDAAKEARADRLSR